MKMKSFLEYFRRAPKTASIAKERLQIIVARERAATREDDDFLGKLQQELLQVIAKYENIDLDTVRVNLDKKDGCEVLELNIVLGEARVTATTKKLAPVTATAS